MDKKHKKKLKRSAKKKKEKAGVVETQRTLKKQIGMFERLPKKCSACPLEFPVTRAAHMTWQVVVRSDQVVRLFCPECQEKAKKLAENNNEV